jgi:hypothetical protein
MIPSHNQEGRMTKLEAALLGGARGVGVANTANPTDLTVFDLLEALTGEVPCYASPNWSVPDGVESSRRTFQSAEDQVEKALARHRSGQDAPDNGLTNAT